MYKCELCGREFKTLRGLSMHVIQVHGDAEEYYNKYINTNAQKTCEVCGRPLNFLSLETGYNQYCFHGKEKTCNVCNHKFPTTRALAFHIGHSHKMSLKEYYDKHLKKPEEGHCLYCKKETKFLNLSEGYAKACNRYCSNMYKYGVDNPAKSEVVKKKAKTNLDRYGAENVFASEYGKQKIRETNLEKFGTESAMQSEEVKQTLRNNIEKRHGGLGGASKTILEKMKQTNLERYGSENIRSSEYGKQKIKESLNRKIKSFEKENDCTRLLSLGLRHSYKIFDMLNIKCIHYQARTYIKNSDINLELFKELEEKFENEARIYNSRYEVEIHEWLSSIHSGKILVNKYNIIKDNTKKQLDFYIPDKKLAIEFNGNYYHSVNTGKDPNYHLNKTQLCQEKGIRLIHIFEYEWLMKKDIIKSIISSALGIYENRLYARECEVREVNSKEARIFLDENHLQGFVASSYRLGLYYNDELVQLLCFGKNRFKKNEVELLRMCTKKNTQVIGGFSKLLKHQPYASFVSYVDLSKFDANGYLENNFKLINQSAPNYKYINGEQILNRISAQKHKLPKLLGDNFDESKTESQNMIDAGYWQIFDCGNLKLKYMKN